MRPRLAVQATGTSNDIIKFFFCLTCGEIVGRYAWKATPSRATLGSVIFVRRRGRRLLPDRRTILRAHDMPDRAGRDAYLFEDVTPSLSASALTDWPRCGSHVRRAIRSANGLTAMAATPPGSRSRPA